MGDADIDTESALLGAGIPLKATILKVGHHGSTSGSTSSFLNAVKPEVALYSAGINNSYHHPSPNTMSALSSVGTTIYGTDQNSTNNINVSDSGYTIKAGDNPVPGTNFVTNSLPVIIPIVPVVDQPKQSPFGNAALKISSVTNPVSKGGNATLTANTKSGANCGITVYFKSGPSSASGLGFQTADSSGVVSWTWKIGNRTTTGNWRIVVTCSSATQENYFEVRKCKQS